MRMSYRSPLVGVVAAALGLVSLASLPSHGSDENPCAAPSASAEPSEEASEEPSPSPSEEPAGGPIPTTGTPLDVLIDAINAVLGGGGGGGEPTPSESASESAEPSESASEAACTPVVVTYSGPTSARYRDIVTFQARVTKTDGTPVSGGTLTFTLEGTGYPVTVGADGTAVVRGRIIADVGKHALTTRYETAQSAGEATAQFTVAKTAAVCGIARQVSGNSSRLTGTLRNPDKSGIAKRNTVFAYNDKPLANAATDANGVSKYIAAKGSKGGVFKVSFRGDTRHGACEAKLKI